MFVSVFVGRFVNVFLSVFVSVSWFCDLRLRALHHLALPHLQHSYSLLCLPVCLSVCSSVDLSGSFAACSSVCPVFVGLVFVLSSNYLTCSILTGLVRLPLCLSVCSAVALSMSLSVNVFVSASSLCDICSHAPLQPALLHLTFLTGRFVCLCVRR